MPIELTPSAALEHAKRMANVHRERAIEYTILLEDANSACAYWEAKAVILSERMEDDYKAKALKLPP